ncbi:uncharacterized protein LOC121385139 [Gigantopelta aegis]|uniref:uncharacterized protein LOC121385139 n=1 Tax=Gigantopelta aegis TaxID=1735272 RepID=UPI001B88932B|nr:uncharacterized protein LOC121385139 [Gigantopelta aegis]
MSFLQKLKEADATLNPDTVTTDYEVATINALQEVFPDTHVHGCLYHLSQCVYRRVQANGLQESYTTDNELSLQIRMIPALAFVPVAGVPATFELIQEDLPEELQPILDYFEDTFIGRARRRGRREPRFQHSMWNCHGAYHPNIWVFLDVLKKEQSQTEVAMTQALAGEDGPPQRRQYRDVTKRLENLVNDYDNRGVLLFLRGIAHNLQM